MGRRPIQPHAVVTADNRFYDQSSYSNPFAFAISHMSIDWTVDFNSKTLTGSVTLQLTKGDMMSDQLILDTKALQIRRITYSAEGSLIGELPYSFLNDVENEDPVFGNALIISLADNFDASTHKIQIDYQTSPSASALQWLNANQTQGKTHPYVYSQCQAIHCRSMIPCQDSPSVKQTYNAVVRVRKDIQVLMSAILNAPKMKDTEVSNDNTDELESFEFVQNVPISSYLIAIVAGNLMARDISPRCRVWCEPQGLDAAAYEFVDVDNMLTVAESIMGPYLWGRYDLLVLPPSFPYGGMENPCLTFVTPTIVTGDRSLVNVVAHEIAHSWSGNLFSNKNWNHFWLNEGHTRFIEGKIVTKLYGEQYGQLFNKSGFNLLKDQINLFGQKHEYTKLVLDLEGVDPDDSYSIVPYEKGAALLHHIQDNCLGTELMEEFLRSVVQKYKYKTLDSDEYVEHMRSYLNERDPEALQRLNLYVDWNAWLRHPGMPKSYDPKFPDALEGPIKKLLNIWCPGNSSAVPDDICKCPEASLDALMPLQIQDFLDVLIRKAPLHERILNAMHACYRLDENQNYEISFRWLLLCAKSHYTAQLDNCLKFVQSVGRMKYLKPIYSTLAKWPDARPRAIQNYETNVDYMHSITATVIKRILFDDDTKE